MSEELFGQVKWREFWRKALLLSSTDATTEDGIQISKLSKKFKDYNKKWFANVVLGNGVECLSPSAVYFLEVSLIFTAIKAV